MIPQIFFQHDNIFAEIFGILPRSFRTKDDPPFPESIDQIVCETHWPLEKIQRRLAICEPLIRKTLVQVANDKLVRYVTLYVGREPRLTLEHVLSLLRARSNQTKILIIDERDPDRALSYALFLREQGFDDVYARRGD